MRTEYFSEILKKTDTYCHLTEHVFTFESYAPKVFQLIRRHFSINDEKFITSFSPDSVARDFVLNKFSEGKSGSMLPIDQWKDGLSYSQTLQPLGFFCITADSKYIIKTVYDFEMKTLLRILPHLYQVCIDLKSLLLNPRFSESIILTILAHYYAKFLAFMNSK